MEARDVRPGAGDDPIAALVLLDEPRRRQLYAHVIAADRPVSRADVASAVGITRALAAFHLDRLVAAGLLAVEYRRLNGRTGPGAGRPAKLYRRTARELAATYPPREYGRAAQLLAQTIERQGEAGRAAAAETARLVGHEVGAAARGRAGSQPGELDLRAALVEQLGTSSFDAVLDSANDRIGLRNCPYHALVEGHRELVCGMNLAWAQGLLDGLGERTLLAELAPRADACCVVFRPRSADLESG